MIEGGILVLGGEGLCGGRIVAEAKRRGLGVRSASRSAKLSVDITDDTALRALLLSAKPGVIINCAAIVSIPQCEQDGALAWRVNARPAAIIAEHVATHGGRYVHISTEHFYTGDGRARHAENAPVRLLNEYARTKFAAEGFALNAPGGLVIRTNFVGWPSANGGSFGEWAMKIIEQNLPAEIFSDQFVSFIDVWSLAEAILDLIEVGATGIVNVGARDVFSKAEFVERLAAALGRDIPNAKVAPMRQQEVLRGDSLGMDVSRVEALLSRPMPGLDDIINTLLRHRASLGDPA